VDRLGFGEPIDWDEEPEEEADAPSLPVILFSAACGVAGGIIAFYFAYRTFGLPVEWSAGIGTLGLLFALGVSGAALSAALGSRAAPSNILFSCGLIVLALLFFTFCALVGGLGALILLS
jgi:hypothetical protein